MAIKNKVNNQKGMTLAELLVVLAIFSIVIAGLYSSYHSMMRQGVKEYRVAQSEMEMGISTSIIKRDLNLAGYGLAEDYSGTGFTPRPASGVDGTTLNATTNGYPDTLTLMGTAVGITSRAAQGWTYMTAGGPTFAVWGDAREDLKANDAVIMMDPSTKKLLVSGTDWLLKYTGSSSAITTLGGASVPLTAGNVGYLVYGLYTAGTETAATQPFYAVKYYLGGTRPINCAPKTLNLLRAESRTTTDPGSGSPIMNCVADFQVAFGLAVADTPDGAIKRPIDTWDNGGVLAAGYTPSEFQKRLKQIRAYVLVQEGAYDANFIFKNPDTTPGYYGTQKIRVGDLYLSGGAVGKDYTLQGDQVHYPWRVVSYIVAPRNIHY